MSAGIKSAIIAARLLALGLAFILVVCAVCFAVLKFGGPIGYGAFFVVVMFLTFWAAAYADIKADTGKEP